MATRVRIQASATVLIAAIVVVVALTPLFAGDGSAAPPVFFTTPPSPNYDVRLDLSAGSTPGDPIIDIFDVSALAPPIFSATCTP
jgi:hypothetical protein